MAKQVIEVDAEYRSCSGTGVYSGFAEAEAMGVWTPEIIGGLGEEMDLENDEVCSIITRAQAEFDAVKKKV
jgi:hypothetical protein